jgi:hypothetical protein
MALNDKNRFEVRRIQMNHSKIIRSRSCTIQRVDEYKSTGIAYRSRAKIVIRHHAATRLYRPVRIEQAIPVDPQIGAVAHGELL